MLKAIITLIISGLMAGSLGGCGAENQKPSEQLEQAIEESGENIMPEKVIDEYLLNYGIDLHESDGTCPKCGEENAELTSVGLCLYCSYDMVYENENDPEIANDESSNNNSNSKSSNSKTTSDSPLDDLMYSGTPTKTIGRFSSNNNKIKEGNDGLLCECAECHQAFFSNRYNSCPNCGSSNYNVVYMTAGELGYINDEIEGNSSYDSFDDLGAVCTLYNRNTGKSYSSLDQRFVIQGFCGKMGLVRDSKENYKIMGCIVSHKDDSYLESESYDYKHQMGGGLIYPIFGSNDTLNSIALSDRSKGYGNVIDALKEIDY